MVKVLIPPVNEPVSVDDFKVWMQGLVIAPEQEQMVLSLLKAGREAAEKYQNAAYCEQTLQIAPDDFSGAIVLPRPPFRELQGITVYLMDGTEQDLTDFGVVNDMSFPVELSLKDGWSLYAPLRPVNPVLITYKAGYDTVPENVRQAILLYASWAWMHRSGDETVPNAFYTLLRKGRVIPV